MLKSALTLFAVAGAGLFGDHGAPTDPVATVDGQVIELQVFEHWMTVAARSTGVAGVTVPDAANDHRRCIATKRKALPPKERQKVTDTRLRTQCRREYAQLRDQVMQLLISFKWIEGEAELRGLTVTDAEVTQAFDQQKRQSFPTEADFQRFMKTSGQTLADVHARVRLDLLSNKLRDQVVAGDGQITDQAIEQHYNQHRSSFVEPETRSLRIVLTKRKADAERARAELERGASWRSVARRYSIDEETRRKGGKLPPLAEGTLENAFEKAVFRARKGRLVGPLRMGSGYYVLTVTKIERERQQALTEVKKLIRQTLESEAEQEALGVFVQDFTARWRAKTECTEGYQMSDCRNGPAPAPTPGWDGNS
jgi:foldase protein PrsA